MRRRSSLPAGASAFGRKAQRWKFPIRAPVLRQNTCRISPSASTEPARHDPATAARASVSRSHSRSCDCTVAQSRYPASLAPVRPFVSNFRWPLSRDDDPVNSKSCARHALMRSARPGCRDDLEAVWAVLVRGMAKSAVGKRHARMSENLGALRHKNRTIPSLRFAAS